MSNNILLPPREWQNRTLPIETLYEQLTILQGRQQTALGMDKPDMAASLQGGIDRINKILAYRQSTDNQEINHNDE